MLNDFYKQFKSGTDIRGVASEGVEGQSVNLTDDAVANMADGFVLWLSKKVNKPCDSLTISVGRDSRISGPHIMEITTKRFKAYGAKVLCCGLASTPSMFMTTVDLNCDGALQITASHHPFNRNGLKFFTREGGLEGSDIEEILTYAQENEHPQKKDGGTISDVDYMSDYAKGLCEKIKKEVNAEDYEHPLKGFKIVVDAGNGAGGFYADKVLSLLGADTEGSRYLNPDGMFPNHVPNPEDATAMASICEAVKESNADLGVIFDTDVDRGGAVDSKGNEINRNRLVAVAAAIALEGNDGGTIVTDSITSSGLKDFIENTLGGKHYRYRRGYKNVIDKALELNAQGINCPLAIETSGHAAMRENYFLDDGAYLCTKIIIKMAQLRKEGKDLDELTSALKEPVESKEIRFKITEKDFRACGEKIIADLTEYAEKQDGWQVADDNREGIRVSFGKENGDGWFLLRLSVHDPIMPLNIESDSNGGVDLIYNQLFEFLKTTNGLDI
ncbi:phosphomannomutase/phosphoglucomutase [uncultured Ruminococcus sp.]|uniref:phosphomannomutase/phosphoglucomutase n=1 Tax=uncultured Ruminococcus sp. TaxID=165186 RepID=UPI0025D6FFDF|nr:phosphomannomutase/phosphoglucomutase [uncultured Ruminococcus sp.]